MNLSQCRNWNAYLLSFAYPPIQACVSYLSAMILLFLDLQGALFHSPLEWKITVNSTHWQKHLGICLPTVGSQTWVRSGWEFFPHKWGIDESNPLEISMASAMKGEPGLATGLTTLGALHPFIRAWQSGHRNLCQARIELGLGPICFLLLYRGSGPFTHCATSAGTGVYNFTFSFIKICSFTKDIVGIRLNIVFGGYCTFNKFRYTIHMSKVTCCIKYEIYLFKVLFSHQCFEYLIENPSMCLKDYSSPFSHLCETIWQFIIGIKLQISTKTTQFRSECQR